MKHLKGFLALLLINVMVMSLSSAGFAVWAEEEFLDPEIFGEEAEAQVQPEPEQPAKQETHKAADTIPAPILSGIDAVQGVDNQDLKIIYQNLVNLKIFTDETFEQEKTLTRAEFANIVARIVMHGENPEGNVMRHEFKDVDDQTAGREAIIELTNLGIVDGYGNGYFSPEEKIKNSEAVVILINMMGYYEIAHMMGDGWEGYLKTARQLKLDQDIDCSEIADLTMGTAVKAIYRVLHERMAAGTYSGEKVTFETTEETVMYHYMDIQTIEGIVDANAYTSLYTKAGRVSEGRMAINGKILDFQNTSTDPADYLGLYTRVYYRGDNEAVMAEYLPKKHNILKINSKDIVQYDEASSTIKYEDKNRMRTQNIPVSINIIFNGVANEGIIDPRKFVPDVGQLVFIDNNNDGKYDVLFIDSYSTYLVKNTLETDEDKLCDDLSVQPVLPLKNKLVKVFKNNAAASIQDVQSGNVALVAASEVNYVQVGGLAYMEPDTQAGDVIKIVATDYGVSGTIESYGDENTVIIDGVEYELDKGFLVAAEKGASSKAQNSRRINVNASVGINALGDIVWMVRSGTNEVKYGYLVNIKNGEEEDINTVKIYTQDDEMIFTRFSDKVKVYAMWENGTINTSSYSSKRFAGNEMVTINQIYREGKVCQQLIQYKLDGQGYVSTLYLPAKDTRSYLSDVPLLLDNVLYLSHSIAESSKEYYYNFGAKDRGGVISPLFEFNVRTTYGFVVPKSSTVYDEKYFSVHHGKEITLFSNGDEIRNMDMYNVDNGVIGAFVYKRDVQEGSSNLSTEFNADSTFLNIIVDEVEQTWDDEADDVRISITAYNRNQLKTFTFAGTDMLSLENKNIPEYSLVPASELKRGDIILVHENSIGEIDGFKIAHRIQYELKNAEDGTPLGNERNWDGTEFTNRSMYVRSFMRGKVVKSIDKIPYVDTNNVNNILRRIILYGSVNQCVIYDVSQDTLTLTQNSSKIANFDEIQDGDYLFWYQSERATLSAVAVRDY